MKKISIYSFLLTVLMLAFSACEKERAFVEYEDLEYGAIPRLVGAITGPYGNSFNYFDLDGSFIEFTVEFYDENNGKNVSNYAWTVSYDGGTPVAMASMDAGSFGTNAEGLPTATFKFTFQDVLGKLGLTTAQVEGGKSFEFLASLTKTNGKVFTRDNTTANLQGQPAFRAFFQNKVSIICPSELEGTFEAKSVGAGPWGCTSEWTGTVKWVHEGNGVYDIIAVDAAGAEQVDFSMGAYWTCYGEDSTLPGGDLRLNDACGKLSYTGQSRWGETYTFNSLTIDGKTLTIDWVNSYGEGAVTTLTRTDKDWPPLTF